ncbi:MAG: isoprenylcysteine carboxylmethyltransferase family protein [Paracoccaceae bacterium]|nr:isoprenylcysteine carboxylmethyltransferase family protein [Paracoccaceae bacterium]
MARALDLPPLWMALFAAFGWSIAQAVPVALPFGGPIGMALVVCGAVLMAAAAGQMVWQHTTFIPRRDPQALVTTGLFALSRNPIYLADALILTGLLIAWQGLLALPLVAVFVAFITRRFIRDEEARIAAQFGDAFHAYCLRTRRWI